MSGGAVLRNKEPGRSTSSAGRSGKSVAGVAVENLKALRFLHQILMIVASAILAFALRPDLSTQYKEALAELSTLKEVSFNTWPISIAERYKKQEEENNAFVLSVIRQAGLELQGHPRLSGPILGEPPPSMPSAKLIEVDAFLTGARKIGSLKVEGNKKYMADQLRRAVASRNAHPSVGGISLSGVGSSGYYGLTDWINVVPTGAMSIQFGIYDQPQTAPNGPIFVIASYTISSETGQFALEWLRAENSGKKLLDPKSGIVFPHLREFWDRVSSLTDDQATLFLQDEMSASGRGTLSFFGIPVERSITVWAGPFVCLAILWFLALHLRHFRASEAQKSGVENYPWIALFRGSTALITIYASLLILPIAANAAVLQRYGHWSEWSSRIGGFLTIILLGVAVFVLVEIHALRRNRSAEVASDLVREEVHEG